MIAKSLEEDATSKQRYLKSLNIDIDPIFVPSVRSQAIGDKSCEEPVEVEEEE